MTRLTDANKLYFYQLFSRRLGFNRQTSLADAAKVLAEDGLAPLDVGLETEQALFAALSDFVKITTFKKGRVYVTVLPHEGFDQAISKLGTVTAADRAAAAGKPWKRKKGAKTLKPQKPRHVEPAVSKDSVEVEPAPAQPKPELEQVADELTGSSLPQAAEKNESLPPQDAQQATSADLNITTEEVTVVETEPTPEQAAPQEPTVLRESEVPHISLNITYIPEDTEGDFEPATADATLQADGPSTSNSTAALTKPKPHALEHTHAPMDWVVHPVANAKVPEIHLQADLPKSLVDEVYITNDFLASVYLDTPLNTAVTDLLESDWQLARSTGALFGTRSQVQFALSVCDPATNKPYVATLSRATKLPSGKHWVLDALAPAPDSKDPATRHNANSFYDTLALVRDAWRELAASAANHVGPAPYTELAAHIETGDLHTIAATLTTMVQNPFGANHTNTPFGNADALLINALGAKLLRAHELDLYAKDPLTHTTLLNTGLMSQFARPLTAQLSPNPDFPQHWVLTGFTSSPESAVQNNFGATHPAAPTFITNPAQLMAPAANTPQATALKQALEPQALSRVLAKLFSGAFGPSKAPAALVQLIAPAEKNLTPQDFRANADLWDALCEQVSEAAQRSLCAWQLDWTQAAPAWDFDTSKQLTLLPLHLGSSKATFALVLEPVQSQEPKAATPALTVRTLLCAQSAYMVASPISQAAQLFA